jgi:hypothetical protein
MRRPVAVLSCLLLGIASCVALLLGSSGIAAGAVTSAAGTFHPVESVRVLDTRTGAGLAGGQVVRFAVTNHGGIPTGAAAATINLTVLRPATAGSITVFPGDTAWNGTASVTFPATLTKQSMVTAKLGADGTLSVRNNLATTIQLIGDVAGYYTGGTPSTPGAFRVIPLQRAFDTRPTHPLAPGSVTSMSIAGHGALPATGVAAVLANLTVLSPSRAGSVSTWASDAAWDGSASVSFTAGRTEQDVVNVALGSNGAAMIRNNTGIPLQVVLDVIGYYRSGTPTGYGTYQPIAGTRVFDNRPGDTSPRLVPGRAVAIRPVIDQRTGQFRIPEWGVPATVVRITVLTPAQAGSLSIFRGDRSWNGSTTISFGAGATVQQQLTVVLGVDGAFQLQYNGAGSISVVADVLGYYLGVPNPMHSGAEAEIDPQRGRLADISCPTPTFCMTVQIWGFAETWNGTGWSTPVRVGQVRTLSSVSCAAADFCVAMGVDATGLVDLERFDGTSWTHAVTLPIPAGAGRLSCASTTFCMAIAAYKYATFDGDSWSIAQTTGMPQESWSSLSCPSAGFCLAADTVGRTSMFDGTGWSAPVNVTSAQVPWSVSCTSASFCVAVGGAKAATFDGRNWSAPIVIDSHQLLSVSCISSTNCRASDYFGSVLSYDGTHWSAPVRVEPSGYGRLSCSNAGTCGLIDSANNATAIMFDGTNWGSPQTVDFIPGALAGVSCTSASFCAAVDSGGYAFSYDGTSWTSPAQIDGGTALNSVSCTSSSFCVTVDELGRALTFDGSDWSSAVPVYPGRLTAVSCTSSSFCVAVGPDQAVTFNGNSWSTPAPIPPGFGPSGVSCRSATFCVAVTSAGLASWFDGTHWSAAQDTKVRDNGLHNASCPTTTYCLAIGWSSLSTWNGSVWSALPVPTGGVSGASCPATGFCVAATSSEYHQPAGQVSVWDGNEWSMPLYSSGSSFANSTISCPSTSFCMVLTGTTSIARLDG